MPEQLILKLEEQGWKRFTQGRFDRLYITANKLGLDIQRSKTGSIKRAWFKGLSIDPRRARWLNSQKTYIDIHSGELHSSNEWLKREAQKKLEDAIENAREVL